jgi:hypothetical protein
MIKENRRFTVNIKKFNKDLKSLLPYIAERLTSDVPLQIPTNAAELLAQAKRESAFAMKHKAGQLEKALEHANSKTTKAKVKSTAGIFQGIAQILEASIIDLTTIEDEEEKKEKKEKKDDGIIDI